MYQLKSSLATPTKQGNIHKAHKTRTSRDWFSHRAQLRFFMFALFRAQNTRGGVSSSFPRAGGALICGSATNMLIASKTLFSLKTSFSRQKHLYHHVQNVFIAFGTPFSRSKHFSRVRNIFLVEKHLFAFKISFFLGLFPRSV